MKIGIANDVNLVTEGLRRLLAGHPDYEVVWTAEDGNAAVEQCIKNKPDVVLMDLIMPNMDGVEATRRIMSQAPCAVLLVSSTVPGNTEMVYDAMSCGAIDVVRTPDLSRPIDDPEVQEFLRKVATVAKLVGDLPPMEPDPMFDFEDFPAIAGLDDGKPPLIAIGASTGGPQAIAEILAGFSPDFRPAMVIAQHLSETFIGGMIEWLQRHTSMPVRLASAGDEPTAGTILVANSERHLYVRAGLTFDYTDEAGDCPHTPSVDVLFHSLAERWPDPGIAVLLTGMGRDGAKGMLALRENGWTTIAQDEESSVVYGMPKAAANLEAATDILALDAMADVIQRVAAS